MSFVKIGVINGRQNVEAWGNFHVYVPQLFFRTILSKCAAAHSFVFHSQVSKKSEEKEEIFTQIWYPIEFGALGDP